MHEKQRTYAYIGMYICLHIQNDTPSVLIEKNIVEHSAQPFFMGAKNERISLGSNASNVPAGETTLENIDERCFHSNEKRLNNLFLPMYETGMLKIHQLFSSLKLNFLNLFVRKRNIGMNARFNKNKSIKKFYSTANDFSCAQLPKICQTVPKNHDPDNSCA